MTLREYILRWQEVYDKNQSRPTTYAAHGYIFKNHILPGLGEIPLSELTVEQVGDFLEERRHFGGHRPESPEYPGLGEHTMRHILRLLQQCLDQAIRDGLIADNPARRFHYPKPKKVSANVLTASEVEDYLDAAERLGHLPMFLLALTAGLRQCELIALKWSDLDVKERTLTITENRSVERRELVEYQDGTRIVSMLETETNVSCGLTLQEICRILFERYPEEACSEQRVREDISILQTLSEEKLMAFELKHETWPHNQRRYKLYHPTFGLNEARMVFDSISISQFLSQSQKNSLISQLEGFLSHSEVQQLKQRVRVRPCLMQNEMLPQTLQVIYRAIDKRKCLCFDYTKFDLKGRQQIRKTYRHIRPIQVVWEQEHYYLVAINPEHAENDQQRNYRIDRMRNVAFDTGEWKQVNTLGFSYGQFDMFSSKEKRTVKFRVHQDLLDMVFETFGTHIICHPDDERQEWIVFSAEVELSGGFDRWVLRQTDKIEVLAPPSVRNRINQLLQNIIASYRE